MRGLLRGSSLSIDRSENESHKKQGRSGEPVFPVRLYRRKFPCFGVGFDEDRLISAIPEAVRFPGDINVVTK
jgi:hypothetical protein